MKVPLVTRSRTLRYGLALAGIVIATLILQGFQGQVNTTTVALTFLLFVLTSATFFGRNPALVASFAAMLSFNFFFIPPFRTFTISDPQNLTAWAAFTLTAIIGGELSAYARRRAEESERLFVELEAAFENAAQTEALERSEKLKTALLDAVTHDLRTPLTSIKASVTALLESRQGHRTIELDAAGESELLQVIDEETDRLNKFIESMVDIARVEAGSLGLRPTWSNIPEIIDAAVARVDSHLSNRKMIIKIEENLPLARVDSRSLAEVLFTLLDNAAKYSPDGSTIEIGSRRYEGDSIEISVADEGEGVPLEQREKIFDKFYRIEGSDRPSATQKGMGLGLAIAKGMIEAQGGNISVTAKKGGKGARFVVRVPIGDE